MTTSANQLYKASNSKLPFKEWLQEEQDNGVLADHEKMFNADGEERMVAAEDIIVKRKPTTKKAQSSIMRNNIIGLAAIGLIIYGLNKYSSQASE